jgi:ABC-2 type transport system ATP-binding protein
MPTLLSVKQLRKVYPGKKPFIAVDGISFELEEGEILGLLGPNGSGKTTTIQMLLGTLTLTSGSILYFGKDFALHRSEILEQVSFASTYTSMPWLLSIAQNLRVFGALHGLSAKESARRFDPLLERFGILDKRDRRVASLSAGQVTRLMLVKAFFVRPKIALLDEPTASLDPDISSEICSFLLEERDRTGMAMLFSSHKMQEATDLCDRAIFLSGGKIIADDVPYKLAQSVSAFSVKLTVVEGMERTLAVAQKSGFSFKVDHNVIEVSLEEKELPNFLKELVVAGVNYANIKIEEPSLEDYFLQIARRKS